MRILFSVYLDDAGKNAVQKVYSKFIESDVSLQCIEEHLGLYDMFSSEIVCREDLCFWDIHLFYEDAQELVEKINTVPTSESCNEYNFPRGNFVIVEEYYPENDFIPEYPCWDKYDIYSVSRFERGASGISAFALKIKANPIFEGILINFIWELIKFVFLKTLSLNRISEKHIYYLRVERFYHNFSKIIQKDKTEFQIVSIKRNKIGTFIIGLRTVENKCYVVKSNFKGKILSFYEK